LGLSLYDGIFEMYVIATWILGAVSVLGVAGTVAAFIFFPTIAAPIAGKVTQVLLGCKACLIAAAFVCIALGSYWYGRHGEYDKGHTAAVAEIAAEDAQALARATEKRAEWKKCRTNNGTWNQSTGECK
jgi:hypothetical protein